MSESGPGKSADNLQNLAKQALARAHDRWVKEQRAMGWQPGPRFDLAGKEHPFLESFHRLPAVEQEHYLHLCLRVLGDLASREPGTGPSESDPGADPSLGERLCQDLHRAGLGETLARWQTLKSLSEPLPVQLFRDLGQHALRLGEPLLAYDIIQEGRRQFPTDVRLRQLLALALLRAGSTLPALELLQGLYDEGRQEEETLGLLARAHKDLAQAAADPQTRRRHWLKAREIYGRAYQSTGGYWSGINAATLARLLGDHQGAQTLARQVQEQCQQQLKEPDPEVPDRYWLYATLGEAALVQGHLEEALSWYAKAKEVAGKRYGDLASTRRNAWLLLEALGSSAKVRQALKTCLSVPRVAVFAGHMIDQPGRAQPRFPATLEGQVSREIGRVLEKQDIGIGYASAACGSDILFLEALLARQGEINVVLPFPPEEFRKTSVNLIPGSDWGDRFTRVLGAATRVVVACEHRGRGSPVVYEYANFLQDGLAILRARLLDTELVPLVVWDGRPGDGPGGTASLVEYWRQQGRPPEIIDLSGLVSQPLSVSALPEEPGGPAPGTTAPEAEPFPQEIRAMLFADVVGYSRLREEQVPGFLQHFMGALKSYLADFPAPALWVNTWGDALHCVFSSVREAGLFALGLRDLVADTDWEAQGLPPGLKLRISLHAGPVFIWESPAFAGLRYSGSHVSRAARIEPITPPNQVYASQEFAALASSQGIAEFICEYVGQVPLPKQAGIMPLYLVRRPFEGVPVGKRKGSKP